MGNFRKLLVWQYAKELAVKIYTITRTGPFIKDLGLKDQIQRSAVSVPSNIAEGSLAELQTQIIIAHEIGYIENPAMESLVNECDKISIMLKKIIKARSENP